MLRSFIEDLFELWMLSAFLCAIAVGARGLSGL